MQMDLCYAGKQEYKCYIVGRNLVGVHDQRVSAGKCAFTSAVEPGHGRFFFGGSKVMAITQ
jgi:hypothetical protein